MKRSHFIFILFFVFLLIALISCKNKNSESNLNAKQKVITDSLADNYLAQLQEIGRILNEAVLNG
ncbi:MAG: hypothetical protein P8Y81_15650, partial [Ignavibacteriaceae bacterium]